MDLQLLVRAWQRNGPARAARHGPAHARPDGGRRHLRSSRRRLRPLFGRRALARAALREDALRQRAAWPARISTRIWSLATTNYARVLRETLDYMLRDMTDPAGGFYSTRRCRQRRRRRPVLHLDAGRNRRRARRRARRDVWPCVRRERRRQLRRPQHSQPAEDARAMREDPGPRAAGAWRPSWPRAARSCSPPARSAFGRAGTTK